MGTVFIENIAETTTNLDVYKSCGCPSWIEHYMRYTEDRTPSCAHCGATGRMHGAHINVVDRRHNTPREGWIIPLCAGCNNPNNTDYMGIDRERFREFKVAAKRYGLCGSTRLPENHNNYIKVIARNHTDLRPSCGCKSWLRHWQNNSHGSATRCVMKDCGAYVHRGIRVSPVDGRRDTNAVWVIPVCRTCGEGLKNEAAWINRRTTPVSEGELDFCGFISSLD